MVNRIVFEDKREYLALLIMQVRRAIYKFGEKSLAGYGITLEQMCVLNYCASHKKVSLYDITSLLLREPHTILGLIDRMKQRGWISKKKDTKSKNKIYISITKKGRQKFQETKHIYKKLSETLPEFSEKELSNLVKHMEKTKIKALEKLNSFYRYPYS